MPPQRKPPPPLTDADIREALRLQSATIRAVTEVLRAKGLLGPQDLVEIKRLRDALAAEIRKHEDAPRIITPERPN